MKVDEQYYEASRIEKMNPDFVASFVPMAKEFYESTGRKLRVTDTFRTYEEQADLYQRKPKLAAPPGKSRHETGDAMDVHTGDVPDLERLGLIEKHGFHRPVLSKGETWHIEKKQTTMEAALKGVQKVAGHVWGLVSPKAAIAAEEVDGAESSYLNSRDQAEYEDFQSWVSRNAPPQGGQAGPGEGQGAGQGGSQGQPNVVQQAVPQWAGGSALDWIEKAFPKEKQPGKVESSFTPATGGAPAGISFKLKSMTDKEWKEADEEGYQKYRQNLQGWGIESPEGEALREPWADPVNVIAGFGGGMAVGGVKAALGSILGNAVGEVAGGVAGEYLTEQQKPQWAWVAALAVDVATGMAVDKAMGKAVARLRKVRPDLNDEQALNVVKAAAGNEEVQEVAKAIPKDAITMGADFGLGQFFKKFFKEEVGEAGQAGPGGASETGIERLKVADIKTDPAFQIKDITKLDVDKFDEAAAGNLLVWRSPEGENIVVNGKSRLELAQRTNVDEINATVLDGNIISKEEAIKLNALVNYSEGVPYDRIKDSLGKQGIDFTGGAGKEDLTSIPPGSGPGINQPSQAGQAAGAAGSPGGQAGAGKPGIEILTKEQAQKMTEAPETDLVDGKYAVNINMNFLDEPDDILKGYHRLIELNQADLEKTRGHMTLAEMEARAEPALEELSRSMGKNPAKVIEALGGVQGKLIEIQAQIHAARSISLSMAKQIGELAKKAASVDGTEADLVELTRAKIIHESISHALVGGTAESGRLLNMYRTKGKETEMLAKSIRDIIEATGGLDLAKRKAALISVLDDPASIGNVVSKEYKANAWDVFLKYWISGLLSGPKTHIRNILGNTAAAFMQVPERYMAGKISRFTGGEVAEGEAAAQFWGIVNGFQDALRAAGKALRTGESSDLLGKVELPRKVVSSQALNLSGVPGQAVDMLDKVVDTSFRLLLTEDEFFKSIGYRMELHAQAYRIAASEGLQREAMAARITDILDNPPENIKLAAIDASRYQTFTDKAGPIAQGISGITSEAPYLKLVVPFVRTPSNIFKFTLQRTPLAPLMTSVREDIKAGGARRDLALARLSLGSMVMMTAGALSSAGYITGGGPQDASLRDNLRREGWQPYSLKIGDDYYAIGGLEPVGTVLGLAADFTEIAGQVPEAQADEAATMIAAAVGKVFTNKTYLRGLSDVVESLSDPTRYGRSYAQRFAGSLIPFTALTSTLEQAGDPTLRETRAGREAWLPALQTMLNEMKSRVPGYSKDLPPRRNLWGEPIELGGGLGPDMISPIYTSSRKYSPVDLEMINNDVGVKMPDRQIKGVDLTAEEYDHFISLAGNEYKDPGTGHGCKEALAAMIKTPEYKRQSEGPDGGRAYMIKHVIQDYREAAASQMFVDFPELKDLAKDNLSDRAEKLRPQ